MSPDPRDLRVQAEEITRKSAGLKAADVEIWGIQAVRSGDWVYVLLGAKSEGDRLDLLIDDTTQGEGPLGPAGITLSLWSPTGIKAGKKKLEISSASRVSWADRLTVVNKGSSLEVTTPDQKAQPRDLPALLLR